MSAETYSFTHLKQRGREYPHHPETVAQFDNPVMLYSIGKDSSVMAHLAQKAFFPARPPSRSCTSTPSSSSRR